MNNILHDLYNNLNLVILTLTSVSAILPVLFKLKEDEDEKGFKWQNLTRPGKMQMILLMLSIFVTTLNYFREDASKKRESQATERFQKKSDSLLSVIRFDMARYGLNYDTLKHLISADDRGQLIRKLNITCRDVEEATRTHTKIISKAVPGSTIYLPGSKDTLREIIREVPSSLPAVVEKKNVDIPEPVVYEDKDMGSGCRVRINPTYYVAHGRCVFINKLSEPVKLYYAVARTKSWGEGKGVHEIAPGRAVYSDELGVGDGGSSGPVSPEYANFDFFFVTTADPSNRKYGKVTLRITACKESRFQLDEESINLTAMGPRDGTMLHQAGIN